MLQTLLTELGTWKIIFLIALFVITMPYVVYRYYKARKIEGIRQDVYKLFIYVEKRFKESGSGKRKMQYVVNAAYQLLPNLLQKILTKEMLEAIIQAWFEEIKDLLDDGKINNSSR